MTPKVSVVMPVYNGERYLQLAIDSILNQTFTDFELIIVDDASKDRTWSVLMENAQRDARIVLVRNVKNAGEAGARNRGLQEVHGEYVAVQDCDDISFPQRLALQVAFLDEHPKVGAIGTAAQRIDASGRATSLWAVPSSHEMIRAELIFTSPLPHTTMMARQALLKQLKGYDEQIFTTDYDLWWRLSCISRLETLPQPVAQYRSAPDPGRITSGQAPKQLIGSQTMSLRILGEIMNGQRLDVEAYKRFFFCMRNQPEYLLNGDIARLQTLWDFLAADTHYRAVAGPRLLSTALKITRLHPTEALKLLRITQTQFGISTTEIVRKYLRVYVREPLSRAGKPASQRSMA